MRIKKIKLTKENLLKIQDIDDLYYKNAITGIDWYLERFNFHHYAYVLMDDMDNYFGYIASSPIKKEYYDAIVSGVIINDVHINPKMYVNTSDYHYISSIVILDEYRNKGFGSELLKSLLKDISNKKYCAITISKEGYNLIKRYMDIKLIINDNTTVFVNKKSH